MAGNVEIVNLLLTRSDLLINARDKEGRTGFYGACVAGNIETVELLLTRNDVDVNVMDNKGKTSFQSACIAGIQRKDLVAMGAQICAVRKLHPSELLREEEELQLQISNHMSQRKSARK
mmetsp:Transcript_241/g.353  ORF Transcript_241/g.353 Transcript_241/m.353 type:complete len:119 (+) Transcript_241:533-889(+)